MNQEKTQFDRYAEVPYYRKQWFFWLMWFIFSPIAIVLLLTGDVYYTRGGQVKAFGIANRIVAAIIGLLWFIFVIVRIAASE